MECQIEGFPGYKISSTGGVRSSRHKGFLRPILNRGGYIVYNLRRDGKTFQVYAHRLVAKAFISNPSKSATVNHLNGNKQDNDFRNLEWTTPSENNRHALSTGLRKPACGSKAGGAKLDESQVNFIRLLLKNGQYLQKDIAAKFKVSRQCIGEIRAGRNWQ